MYLCISNLLKWFKGDELTIDNPLFRLHHQVIHRHIHDIVQLPKHKHVLAINTNSLHSQNTNTNTHHKTQIHIHIHEYTHKKQISSSVYTRKTQIRIHITRINFSSQLNKLLIETTKYFRCFRLRVIYDIM